MANMITEHIPSAAALRKKDGTWMRSCAAYDSRFGCCSCLEEPDCGKRCPFFRRWTAYEESRSRVYLSLQALPPARQLAIAEKYYGGRLPWLYPENRTAVPDGLFPQR